MALPVTRDTTESALDLVNSALRKLHVLEEGTSASDAEVQIGLTNLRYMLRTWAVKGVRLWLTEEQTITLAAATASYTLDPRVLEVSDAFRRSGGNDTPIQIFDREEYMRLPNKSVSGDPYAIWIDRQRAQAVAYVYPVPSSAGDTVEITTKRQILDAADASEELEVPPEWSGALVYNLAVWMAPEFRVDPDPVLLSKAATLYEDLEAQDRGHSVHMGPRRR
ncbi:MAG: hypothetical protein AAGF20_00085 [Pseudomonadota bacterium]